VRLLAEPIAKLVGHARELSIGEDHVEQISSLQRLLQISGNLPVVEKPDEELTSPNFASL